MRKIIISLFCVTLLAACAGKTTVVDTSDQTAMAGMQAVMALEYRDFEKAAMEAVESMLASGAVSKPDGGRYVLAVSRITNDTMQRIDTDQLVKKIRTQLLQSGKVVVTTAIGLNGAEDPMVMKARQLRQSGEVNQNTVAQTGKIIAPDLSLSGKIIQKNIPLGRNKTRVEYYVQLTLSEIETGLAFWEGETPIIKEGKKAPIW